MRFTFIYLLVTLYFIQKNYPQILNNTYMNNAIKQVDKLNFIAAKGNIYNLNKPDNASIHCSINSGLFQLLNKPIININVKHNKKSDTLYIIKDTIISGEWNYNGTIVITDNSSLHFKKAKVTVLGDIIVFGYNSALLADSSYLYFPQQYFYQRYLMAVNNAIINIRNSTLDYSDLSHNIVATNYATIDLFNVYNKGFTTNGAYDNSVFKINGSNQAGEYVITAKADLSFKNANTILLWHHFPDSALINFSFPKGDSLQSYTFNKMQKGVKGVGYNIMVDNCTDVMWGIMPAGKANITIRDSEIRAIGLWFLGDDSVSVSGLVNNSKYTDFIAPLSDRYLRLVNTKVRTWSLYSMENSFVDVNGCIVGEIGSMGFSKITATSSYIDGSGGYYWAGDNSLNIAGFSTATTSVRSQNKGFFIFAYSALTNGLATATSNSVLFVIQSSLPKEPVALDAAVVWYLNIDETDAAFTDTIVPINGSVWIDKAPLSNLMDFNYFKLFYQATGDNKWVQIGDKFDSEVRKATLGYWNTKGLNPGQYTIKIALTDNTPEMNTLEAVKNINLLPAIMKTETLLINNDIKIYKEDSESIIIQAGDNFINIDKIVFIDITGRIFSCNYWLENNKIYIDTHKLASSLYICQIFNRTGCLIFKIIK